MNFDVEEVKALISKRFNERTRFDIVDTQFWISIITCFVIFWKLCYIGYDVFDLIGVGLMFGAMLYYTTDAIDHYKSDNKDDRNLGIEYFCIAKMFKFIAKFYIFMIIARMICEYFNLI